MNVLKALGLSALAAVVAAGAGIAQTHAPQPVTPAASAAKVISFGQVSFDPASARLSETIRYRTAADGQGLHLVQFNARIRGEWLGDLQARGIRPLQYYPHDTYLVWTDANAAESLRAWPQIRWQGEYRPEWKLESGLDKRSGVIRNIAVHFYNDGDVGGVLASLRANGANVLNHGPAQSDGSFHDAWVEIDATRLAKLADLPQVVWLEYASPKPILDDEMSSLIQAGEYGSTGAPQLGSGYLSWLSLLGYNGTGVIWSVIDTGIDLTHPDLASRIIGGTTYPGCPAGGGAGDDNAAGGHGTHVAGIIGGDGAAGFADGNGFKYGIGVGHGVQFWAQNPICTGSVPWPPAGGWQQLSKDALAGGAIGGNASWTTGESGGTTYTAGARAMDQMVRDGNFDTATNEAFIMVFSAGNSGPGAGTLTAPKAAKNPIITASAVNFRAGSINNISGFSSRGPTQDGRYGITIAAPGEQIASARRVAGASQCSTAIGGTNNTYAFCSGTSMAAPHASGAAALLTQWWRDNNVGATPSPAMIKALLINGAVDMSGVANRPNAIQGWGRVHIPGSMGLDFLMSEYVDQSVVLDSVGEVYEVTFGVAETDKPLMISLTWTDAAAAAGANPALVNNLDLEVDTDGQTYRGNVFSGGMSVTGGTADSLNNVENVFVAAPGSSVTLRVRATNLPGDGIPGVGSSTDQDFALVCRNCVEEAGFTLSANPSAQSICTPADAQYDIDVGSILGYTSAVTLSVTGQPSGTTATFAPNSITPPGSSVLTVGNTGAAAAGSYDLEITGTSVDQVRHLTRSLQLATAIPDAPVLDTPANNAVNVGYTPTLSWQAADQAESYRLELATDAGFTSIIADEVVADTSYTVGVPLNSNTTYYWRVTADNACGIGSTSQVFQFKTQPAPGDCDDSTIATQLFAEDFSGGMGDFATTGSTGASTWAISSRPGSPSGGNTVRAIDIPTVSDQRLISPPISLPADQSPLTLQFWNDQTIEQQSNGASCWDGGILEVSTDTGATWTQFSGSELLVEPYIGPIGSGFDNPLTGLQAWCGDPQPWQKYIVDIDAYAGQTVQFRWRLGTDRSVGRPDGWHIDDIVVQSCAVEGGNDEIFVDGFELSMP